MSRAKTGSGKWGKKQGENRAFLLLENYQLNGNK